MAEAEHERVIWEHFQVLRQETQSKLLHGLFGATHPPHYPGGSHELYGTHAAAAGSTAAPAAGARISRGPRRASEAAGLGLSHPVHAASHCRPPVPGEPGFASALAARVMNRSAIVEADDNSSGGPSPRSVYMCMSDPASGRGGGIVAEHSPRRSRAVFPGMTGTAPLASGVVGSPPTPTSVGTTLVSQMVEQPLQQQQDGAETYRGELSDFIGRALIAGNCLLDALPNN